MPGIPAQCFVNGPSLGKKNSILQLQKLSIYTRQGVGVVVRVVGFTLGTHRI